MPLDSKDKRYQAFFCFVIALHIRENKSAGFNFLKSNIQYHSPTEQLLLDREGKCNPWIL